MVCSEIDQLGDVVIAPEERRKLFDRLLDLLTRFDAFCEQNGLPYFVYGGALLGAVRERGFIPWDDDIDILMPRDSFERFLQTAPAAFQYPYTVQHPNAGGDRSIAIARLKNGDTTAITTALEEQNQGIFISIVPLDGLPDSPFLQKLQSAFIELYKDLLVIHRDSAQLRAKGGFKYAAGTAAVEALFAVLGERFLRRRFDFWCRRYTRQNAVYVGRACRASYAADRQRWKREWFDSRVRLDFENTKIWVPVGYRQVLATQYGDYMTPPPPEKRSEHCHFKILDPDRPFLDYFRNPALIDAYRKAHVQKERSTQP